jgi:Domain of unknown function (DUF4124)
MSTCPIQFQACGRRLMSALIAILLLPGAHAVAQDTVAQRIHTCVDARGTRSYQNLPCAADQRTASVRSYEARPEDPTLAARTAAIQQEMDRRNRPSGKATVVRAASLRRAGPTPCQAAKTRREATLKQVGLKRTYDLLSRLDSEVWELCKGL